MKKPPTNPKLYHAPLLCTAYTATSSQIRLPINDGNIIIPCQVPFQNPAGSVKGKQPLTVILSAHETNKKHNKIIKLIFFIIFFFTNILIFFIKNNTFYKK
jgi:hypothetical protein